MRKFSYQDSDNPVIQETIRKALRNDLGKFREWQSRRVHPLELRKQYEAWWLQLGPVNFTSSAGSRRYKEELWQLIQA